MTPEEIRIELYKRRNQIPQVQIARSLGVSHIAIYRVINRDFVSNRIMKAIADAIELPKEQVWPEYYSKKASS